MYEVHKLFNNKHKTIYGGFDICKYFEPSLIITVCLCYCLV